MTYDFLKNAKKAKKQIQKRRDFIVSVLLSAHAKRVGVSRMRDFLYNQLIGQPLKDILESFPLIDFQETCNTRANKIKGPIYRNEGE